MKKIICYIFLLLISTSCASSTDLFSIIDQGIYIEPYITQDNIESRDKIDGSTPLIYACEKGDVTNVKVLLDNGANINAVDKYRNTCLMWAIYYRKSKVVNLLIEYKADASLIAKDGDTAIKNAIGTYDLELIKQIIKMGGNPNTSNANFDPLILAAHKGDYDFSKELIEKHKLDVNASYYPYSYSPLLQAVEYGHTDIVKLLLSHGANMYHRDKLLSMTALELARYKRHKDIEKVLLDAGAKY